MSKRWVKLSRGVLLGTLMIMGSAQAEEPPKPAEVPAVVESIIEDAALPVASGRVAEAEKGSDAAQQVRARAPRPRARVRARHQTAHRSHAAIARLPLF